ncbi:hypothetical protein ABZ766_13535 [Streptomyces sp. NPDC006670]
MLRLSAHPDRFDAGRRRLTGSEKDSTSSIGKSVNLSMSFYQHKN